MSELNPSEPEDWITDVLIEFSRIPSREPFDEADVRRFGRCFALLPERLAREACFACQVEFSWRPSVAETMGVIARYREDALVAHRALEPRRVDPALPIARYIESEDPEVEAAAMERAAAAKAECMAKVRRLTEGFDMPTGARSAPKKPTLGAFGGVAMSADGTFDTAGFEAERARQMDIARRLIAGERVTPDA